MTFQRVQRGAVVRVQRGGVVRARLRLGAARQGRVELLLGALEVSFLACERALMIRFRRRLVLYLRSDHLKK